MILCPLIKLHFTKGTRLHTINPRWRKPEGATWAEGRATAPNKECVGDMEKIQGGKGEQKRVVITEQNLFYRTWMLQPIRMRHCSSRLWLCVPTCQWNHQSWPANGVYQVVAILSQTHFFLQTASCIYLAIINKLSNNSKNILKSVDIVNRS